MKPLHTRRRFLRSTALGGALGTTLPSFLAGTLDVLHAAEDGKATSAVTGRDAPILVVLQLAGGNDGLNTVVPHGNDHYRRARPNLGLKSDQVLKADGEFGFHPALGGFHRLFEAGRLAVVQGVGYPNPNRSHFRSTEIWASASDSDRFVRHGWVGRYFDHACAGAEPTVGIALGRQMPQAFAGASGRGVSLENPAAFRYVDTDTPEPGEMAGGGKFYRQMNQPPEMGESGSSIGAVGGVGAGAEDPVDFLERVALDAQVSSDRIREVAGRVKNQASYPATGLASNLALVSRLIAGGMPTRVYYVSQGGYDTHTNQAGSHERLLRELGDAVAAFVADLEKFGQLDRTLVMTFSEFGRRVKENASGGTDHGAGAPMFLAGGRIRAGLRGTPPSLAPGDLLNGDVRFNLDFRSVYAGVLQQWLKTNPEAVLGRKFPVFDVV